MVRYDISAAELIELIDAEKPRWREAAALKTAAINARGYYDKKLDGDGWGEIKPVYMRLQANKCAYCERKLSGPPYGNREHDVEHFRPKGRLRAWPNKKMHKHLADPDSGELKQYPFELGSAHDDKGYAWLAFSPWNYCTACARCNQSLKSDFFPVGASRLLKASDPAKMKTERAYLPFPIGDIDTDPRKLLTFNGVVPRPKAKSGFARQRAEVTIDFFALDSEDLAEERADIISKLYFPLKAITQGESSPEFAVAKQAVALSISPRAPHSTCALAFKETFAADPALARRQFDAALATLEKLR